MKSRLAAAEADAQARDANVASLKQALLHERHRLQLQDAILAEAQRQLAEHQQQQQPSAAQVQQLRDQVTSQAEQLAACARSAQAKSADAAELRKALDLQLGKGKDLAQKLAAAREQVGPGVTGHMLKSESGTAVWLLQSSA